MTGSRPRLSIETPPNYGDFKAFTNLDRRPASVLAWDPASRRLSVDAAGQVRTVVVGGPAERMTKRLAGRQRVAIQLVDWGNLCVIGVPSVRGASSGHQLFRAEYVD